jgi:hypothetical protein
MQANCLCQVLRTFFQVIGDNKEAMGELLKKMRGLRREYLKLLREDFVAGLLTANGDGSIKENFSRERLAILLEKIIHAFRSDQENSYRLLQQGIYKQFLEDTAQQALTRGIEDVQQLHTECQSVTKERDVLATERDRLQKLCDETSSKYVLVQHHEAELQERLAELSQQVAGLVDQHDANQDYQTIIREIRKEIEEKKELDMWRLKVFYNRVAALTKSNWSCPGVPKPELFAAKSKSAQQFLDSFSTLPNDESETWQTGKS